LIVPYCPRAYLPPISLPAFLSRLLLYHSRWAGYLQSLPKEQNWHGIALFWDAAPLRDPLSSSDDGIRVNSGGLGPDSDAVEARQWLRGTEAETYFLLPDPSRTPILVCPLTRPTVTSSPSQKLTLLLTTCNRTIFRASTLPPRRPFSSVWAYPPRPREDFNMPMRSSVLVHSWLTDITAWPWYL
jgi:hypothetical protein